MGLAAPVLKALDAAGYENPTPIQAQAIPFLIEGEDILGIAQTGTGKTAAFALPILHRLATERKGLVKKTARVLVLSPTRELAAQLAESFNGYATNMRIKVATIVGGVAYGPQYKALGRGVDVLIATPGRLLDHISSGSIRLDQTEILVLDEADQMLDLGFVKPIRDIVSKLPAERQSLLFSATMPKPIAALAREFLNDPKQVSVAPVSSTAERVSQSVIHVNAGDKRALVVGLINDQKMPRTIVFTRTKRGADKVAKYLDTAGIRASAIHGNKSQNQRERALDAFKGAKVKVLVATDIAARGIDISDVSHVINYELPEVPEAYVHRIGRTARAGASGSAVSLCDRSEMKYLRGIEKLIRQKIPSSRAARIEGSGELETSAYDPLARSEAIAVDDHEDNKGRGTRRRRPKRATGTEAPSAGRKPSRPRRNRKASNKSHAVSA